MNPDGARHLGVAGSPGGTPPEVTASARVDDRAVTVMAEALYYATYHNADVEPWPDAWPERTRMCQVRITRGLVALGTARGEIVWKPEPLRYSSSAHKVWYVGESTVIVDDRGRASVDIELGGCDPAASGRVAGQPVPVSAGELRALAGVILAAADEVEATTEGGSR